MAYLRELRGRMRWQAEVKIKEGYRSKLFEDDSSWSKRQAENWEEETKKEFRNYPPLTLEELVERYLIFSKAQYLEKTYQEKKRTLKRFVQFFSEQTQVETITVDHCLRYLQSQVFKRGGSAANRDRKEMGAAWQWGHTYLAKRFVQFNPWHEVRKWKCEQAEKYIPPIADFQKVVEAATGQDRVMLITFQQTAARRSEIFQLKWRDIDWEYNFIRLWTRKRNHGNKEFDWLPMTKELQDILRSWKKEQAASIGKDGLKYVFVDPRTCLRFQHRKDFLRNMCDKTGVKRFTWHAIRHLSARYLYQNGAPFDAIQTLLRHKNPTTTAVYLKRIGSETARVYMNELLSCKPVTKPAINDGGNNLSETIVK